MIDKSDQINELAGALSKAQAKFRHVAKDKTARIRMKAGGEYSYNYADLGSTWDAGRLPLTENGLSVSQLPSFADGWLMLDTILMHASGQYISSQMKTRADEMDVKSIGSAITYLRRYAFAAIIGLVADEDDDGSAPNPKPATRAEYKPAPARASAPAANNDRRDLMDRAMTLYTVMKEQGLKYRGKMFKDMDLDELRAAIDTMSKQLDEVAPAEDYSAEYDAVEATQ